MRLRPPAILILAAVAALAAGCSIEPYDTRMKFLDQMSTEGIKYRGQLQKQGTEPDEKSCNLGYELLKPNIPRDTADSSRDYSQKWGDQVRESYVKSCMTGGSRPKPDPSGVKAVTPVPYGSESPAPVPSGSAG